jgi:O-antigen/teichoic acid export membrane protein
LPRMTRLQARQGTVALLNHFSVNFRRVTWGTGLMLLLALVFSREISWLIGGVEFSSAWQTLQFMLVFSGCVVLADNIFTGIHFPLDRERLYVLAYSGLFVISLAATAILISTLKSADSVALAMMSGAVVLLGLAIWQVNDLPGLLMSLLRSIVPVAFTVFLGLSSRLIEPLGWRILMGVIGFWLICLDMLRSDQAAQRIVRSGMGYVRLMAQRWF